MTSGRHDVYERALHDEAFRLAVRERYRGSRDVLDALWWRAHPDRPSPRGEESPGCRVRALQRRVFAADADAAGDEAVHRALRELEAEIITEQDAIDDAVTAVFAVEQGHEDAEPAGAPQLPPAEPESPVRPSRSRVRAVAVLAAAAVLGGVAGAQIVLALGSGADATSAAAADAPALDIFDRPQAPADVPVVPLPASFQPLTVRYLGSISWGSGPQPAESPYYGARADGDRVCLVLMIDSAHYLSTCVGESEFAASGLGLYWTNDLSLLSDGLATLSAPRNWSVEWTPNGAIGVGPAASADAP